MIEFIAAAISLGLALFVFIFDDAWTFVDWAALAVGAFGVVLAVDAWRLRTSFLLDAEPAADEIFESCEWPARKPESALRYAPDLAQEKARIDAIVPAPEETRAGFMRILPGMGCEEPAFASPLLDDWLIQQPHIAIRRDQKTGLNARLSQAQKQLLWARVKADTETTDDQKLCLLSDFDTVPITDAKVGMRTYFDSMVSNEAFRSRVFQKPSQSATRGEMVADFADLKSLVQGTLGPQLPRMGQSPAANHIGASALIITADHRPVLFQQGIKQEEGAGRIVVSGTGSADWTDMTEVPGDHGLLDIVRITMFREFLEEGTVMARSNVVSDALRAASYLPTKRLEMAQELSVIGYFRWVSRFGKPEFLGFGRTPLLAKDIVADSKEVVDLTGRHQTRREVRKMGDLVDLYTRLQEREDDRALQLSLSSAMVIHRLAEIAKAPESVAYQTLSSRHGLAP